MAKRLLIVLGMVVLAACSKKNEVTPAASTEAQVKFEVLQKTKLSTGEVVEAQQKIGSVHIWKADSKTFSVSFNDAISGYAFDESAKKSVKADKSLVSGFATPVSLAPGRYFVFVITDASSSLSSAYSYTYFDAKAGQAYTMKKVFSETAVSLGYEAW